MKEKIGFGTLIKAGVPFAENATIQTSAAVSVVSAKNGKDFSLGELQKFVGGYIEIVRLSGDYIMIVDEEGQLKNKPLNILASKAAGQTIVGDALITHLRSVK